MKTKSIILLLLIILSTNIYSDDKHWSKQFKKPKSSNKMLPSTGMSDATNKPIFRKAKWHDGKLYICGAWESGASGWNINKRQLNDYWYLWSWSSDYGYEPICHFHSAQGGVGPDGKINDFLWLPDGRLVVAGEFTRIDNPGGVMYHRVGALAIYDPKEPSANKWKPLGSFQYNGNGGGGAIYCLAYDRKGNDLYMGGTFGGIKGKESRKMPVSSQIHRYDFDTNSLEPLVPGVGGSKPAIYKIFVDNSTTPSTIYVGGKFHYTAGNGLNPVLKSSTAKYSTGFAHWQQGKGWTTYPNKIARKLGPNAKDMILQRSADFKYFDSVRVLDFLVDGKDIWIVGAFSQGKGSSQKFKGIAKWDRSKQMWIDPTGKGGVGREVYSIAKANNGKIYFAGAFGGPKIKGFQNGDAAHMAMSFDPATNTWAQLGSGLAGRSMPECRLTTYNNDVYFVGDFNYIGAQRTGRSSKDKAFESWYIARWNEDINFDKNPAKLPKKAKKSQVFQTPTATWSTGNEHWSRAFPKPARARGKISQMSAKTGMDDGTGTPNITGVIKYEGVLYFCGRWEAIRGEYWHVWQHSLKSGWQGIAVEKGKNITGVGSPPKGMKLKNGKLWIYGSISNYAGIAIYDLSTKKWSPLTGKTENGKDVFGNSDPNRGSPVNDIAWDNKTGDLYLVGSRGGLENSSYSSPKAIGQVIRIDKNNVYHPMGRMLMAEMPTKPVLVIDSIYIDESVSPSDIYLGGTFNYYGRVSSNKRMLYNIAKWNYKTNDWGPVGEGTFIGLSALDKKHYPKGLPGLVAKPELYRGFLAAGFPRIRCMTMDKAGNLYVGGTLAIVDNHLPVVERKETFGIAKLDAKTNKWTGCTKVGGVSRDIFQMTFIDKRHLLLSGGFHFDNSWQPLHGAAILDIKTGELKPFGGGLLRKGRSQVISSDVCHFADGDDIYFAGLFDYAGININDLAEAPIESNYIAHWNSTKNFDPNSGLMIAPISAITRPQGFSSKSIQVKITASVPKGKITWYEKRTNGQFAKKGQGNKYTARLRISSVSPDPVIYVTVTVDGIEGGKKPVRIPVK
ncbi:hypothetical protein [Candidatus Uabimicrobium sp. HlEnr_7]|uniref:hypothetical protein n=1 Tax=Candidatus Uabimicrobium helgolandensis TaxID=3095367 RepID=UPI0035566EB4